jgi:4-aminobutyrate aminotransferase-like enzyme
LANCRFSEIQVRSSLKTIFLSFYEKKSFHFRYPLEDFARENAAEDQRCLAQVEDIFESQRKKGSPISGMIVEPIQSEGGDHHGSNVWFQVTYLILGLFETGCILFK